MINKDENVTWLGRVRLRDEQRSCCARVVTQGRSPDTSDVFDVLHDPFDDKHWPTRMRSVWDRLSDEDAVVRRSLASLADVDLLAPCRPNNVLGVARNYRAHAAEVGGDVPSEPSVFQKPNSAVVGSGSAIVIPQGFERIDMESEFVAIIGKRCRSVPIDDALQYVAGYTLGNDVTVPELCRRDKHWTRAKGFDTFAPIGPWIRVTEPGWRMPRNARIQGHLDGELRQDAPLEDKVFSVAEIVAHVSAFMTLTPGDAIYTGTPQGVSAVRPGQTIEISVQGFELGTLRNSTV